jgi:septum site-determining protein MinC
VPVGITNASEDVKKAAAALNLPYFIGTRLQLEQQKAVLADVQEEEEVPAAAEGFVEDSKASASVSPQPAAEPLPPMVVTHSVRSGQQIFAQNRSLVVLGSVSSGAEVMADEDVVVLGALKGRALAGIGGNVRARIVCQSFDAELISIAHCFTTCDDLEQDDVGSLQLHKPTAISLQDDRLHFESSTV